MRTLKQGLMAIGDVYHASFTSYEVFVCIKMLLDCILVSFELSVYHMLGTTNMAMPKFKTHVHKSAKRKRTMLDGSKFATCLFCGYQKVVLISICQEDSLTH